VKVLVSCTAIGSSRGREINKRFRAKIILDRHDLMWYNEGSGGVLTVILRHWWLSEGVETAIVAATAPTYKPSGLCSPNFNLGTGP